MEEFHLEGMAQPAPFSAWSGKSTTNAQQLLEHARPSNLSFHGTTKYQLKRDTHLLKSNSQKKKSLVNAFGLMWLELKLSRDKRCTCEPKHPRQCTGS